ncbi:MAG: hypothetical protein ACYTBZ_29185 [Planctomycetota bacterium]|jgi:hypothetical protein
MKSRNGVRHIVVFAALISFTPILISAAWCGAAHAATQAEILDRAQRDYRAGQYLIEVISQAVHAALEGGIALEDLAAPLAETLMEAGLQLGQDGTSLTGSISANMFQACTNVGARDASLFRTVSQTTQGIRAAAAKAGLDANRVRVEIKFSLTMASSPEVAQKLARVIDAAYQKSPAETYTAVAEAPAQPVAPALETYTSPPQTFGPPEPPSSVPTSVGEAFDNTASSS